MGNTGRPLPRCSQRVKGRRSGQALVAMRANINVVLSHWRQKDKSVILTVPLKFYFVHHGVLH